MIKKIISITSILLYSSITYSQFPVDTLALKEEVSQAIQVLSDTTPVSKVDRRSAYMVLLSNYCFLKTLSDVDTSSIFSFIQLERDSFFQRYLNFIYVYAGCFSKAEYSYTRKILSSYAFENLNLDIIGMFRLDKFKARIYQDTLKNWHEKILNDINIEKSHYSLYNYEDISLYATLASLGDTVIENKITNLLYNYLNSIENKQFESEQSRLLQYQDYYLNLLPVSLGKIYTKSSVIKSLRMMENYDSLKESTGTAQPFCYYYINQYLVQRLHPNKRTPFLVDYFLNTNGSIEMLQSFVRDIKYQAMNDKLPWFNLFDYWDED